MDGPAFGDLDGGRVDVQHVPRHIPDMSLGDIAYRHRDRGTRVTHLSTAAHAISGFQGNGPDQVVPDVQGSLQRDHLLVAQHFSLDMKRVADLRYLVSRELNIHDRADDPGNTTDTHRCGRICSGSHFLPHSFPADSASAEAPPTISEISWVISAWRAWLASRVRRSISCCALSVADFMARCLLASSDALELSSSE